MASCIECGNHFTGQTNKVYCSVTCRKRAENNRAKMNRIMQQLTDLSELASRACQSGDYHQVRISRARVELLQKELRRLASKYQIEESVLWLQRFKRLIDKHPTELP
jgi:hypothetical protein